MQIIILFIILLIVIVVRYAIDKREEKEICKQIEEEKKILKQIETYFYDIVRKTIELEKKINCESNIDEDLLFDGYLGIVAHLLDPPVKIKRRNRNKNKFQVADILFFPGNPSSIPKKYGINFYEFPENVLIYIIREIGNLISYFDIHVKGIVNPDHFDTDKLTKKEKNVLNNARKLRNETANKIFQIFNDIGINDFNLDKIFKLIDDLFWIDINLAVSPSLDQFNEELYSKKTSVST